MLAVEHTVGLRGGGQKRHGGSFPADQNENFNASHQHDEPENDDGGAAARAEAANGTAHCRGEARGEMYQTILALLAMIRN